VAAHLEQILRPLSFALTVAALATSHAAAELKFTADAPLHRDELRRRFDWVNTEEMQSFDRLNAVQPEWQDRVRAFIAESNRHLQQQPTSSSSTEHFEQANELSKAGIDDPLFQFHAGMTKIYRGENQAAFDLLIDSYRRFSEQPYPARLRYLSAGMAWFAARQTPLPTEQASWQQTTYKELPGFLAEWSEDARQRYVLALLQSAYQLMIVSDQQKEEWIKFLDQETEVNDWSLEFMRGRLHKDLAWKARGDNWASTVTDDRWQIFENEMALAAKHFQAAWKMHPEFPEPASEMISISLSAGTDRKAARQWLDRAVKGEADYVDAYGRFRMSLLPRWGGSYAELMMFGDECARTERFDTDIPYQLVASFFNIVEEQDRAIIQRVLSNEQLYQRLADTLRKSAEDPARSTHAWGLIDSSQLRIIHLALALHAKRAEESIQLLKKIDDVDYGLLEKWNVDPALLAGVAYATNGNDEAKALQLLRGSGNMFQDAETVQEWLDELQALKKKINDPRTRAFFDTTIRSLDYELRFQKGEWVTLAFCDDQTNWTRTRGNWHYVSETEISAQDGSGSGLELVSRNVFPTPVELKVTIRTYEDTTDGVWTGVQFGGRQQQSPLASRMFLVNPVTHQACATHDGTTEAAKSFDAAESYELHLELWNRHYRVHVNHQLVLDQHDESFQPLPAIELVSLPAGQPVYLEFQDFRVRKLDDPGPAKK
jgi:hypothetical protein